MIRKMTIIRADEVIKLGEKRKDLILRVLGFLYKGQIGNLMFKKGLVYKVDYYKNYNGEEKKTFSPITDFEFIKAELLKNIHDIAKKLNGEHLSILEFIMDKMEMNYSFLTTELTHKNIPKIKDELNQDTKEIKERCGNILMLMEIENEN